MLGPGRRNLKPERIMKKEVGLYSFFLCTER